MILDMEEVKIERYNRRKLRKLVQTQAGDHFARIVFAKSYHSEPGKEYPHS